MTLITGVFANSRKITVEMGLYFRIILKKSRIIRIFIDYMTDLATCIGTHKIDVWDMGKWGVRPSNGTSIRPLYGGVTVASHDAGRMTFTAAARSIVLVE